MARAIHQKDIGALKKAIADSEEAGYPELAADICKARDTLEALGGGRGGQHLGFLYYVFIKFC